MTSKLRRLATFLITAASVRLAEGSNVPNRLPPNSFRPRSHIVKIEKYKFESPTNDTQYDAMQGPDNSIDEYDSANASNATIVESNKVESGRRRLWGRFDDLDKQIMFTTLPLSAIFAIMPISMALDLFWVNRLGDTLAVAGQAAANQVYNSAFWLFSFLPSVTATLVSKAHADGDLEGIQDSVCQALIMALGISAIGTSFMFFRPTRALTSILKAASPAMETARPYLKTRSFSFMPMLISFVGFSTFRGTMDVKSSVAITLTANAVTALLDPLLIHGLGLGVRGAAFASVSGDVLSALTYLKLLNDRNLIPIQKLLRIPAWSSIAPLLKGGLALQIRSLAMNLSGILVARTVQSIDTNGVAPAAHALVFQTFHLGGILLGALGMSSQTLVPNAMAKGSEEMTAGSTRDPSGDLVKRIFAWGLKLGFGIGMLQMLFLPKLLSSSPLAEVREAARTPALIALAFQGVNGIVNVGEGILMGTGHFTWLSINIVVAALCYAGAIQFLSDRFALTGVWMSFAVFTSIRLVGVIANPLIREKIGLRSKESRSSQ